jgi:hypothetical protein
MKTYSKVICAFPLACVLMLSTAWATVSLKEKMLLRYILQNEFLENGRLTETRELINQSVPDGSFDGTIKALADANNSKLRMALIFRISIRAWGNFDEVKAREALRLALKAEKDKWFRLDIARVLASMDDDSGKDILVSALLGKEGYQTSSGIEINKSIVPLLLLDYSFPDGFPNTAGWGGLGEYYNGIQKEYAAARK